MAHHRRTEDRKRHFARIPIKQAEIYMPAMPPLALMEAIGRWFGARRRRRALEQLLTLDRHLLVDIGLDRERVTSALRRGAGPGSATSGSAGAAKPRKCA